MARAKRYDASNTGAPVECLVGRQAVSRPSTTGLCSPQPPTDGNKATTARWCCSLHNQQLTAVTSRSRSACRRMATWLRACGSGHVSGTTPISRPCAAHCAVLDAHSLFSAASA